VWPRRSHTHSSATRARFLQNGQFDEAQELLELAIGGYRNELARLEAQNVPQPAFVELGEVERKRSDGADDDDDDEEVKTIVRIDSQLEKRRERLERGLINSHLQLAHLLKQVKWSRRAGHQHS
jgi:hypothetical protein